MKAFLMYVDQDFDFLRKLDFAIEPSIEPYPEDGVEIPDELWERWQAVTKEFEEVQQELMKVHREQE